MLKMFATLMLIVNGLVSLAQTNTDSLRNVWENGQNDLNDRFSAINEIAVHYNYRNVDSAMKYSKIQLAYSDSLLQSDEYDDQQKTIKKWNAQALSNIGICHDLKDNLKESLVYHNRSLKIKTELKDSSGIAGGYINKGSVYRKMGKMDSAMASFNRGIEMCRKIGHDHFMANGIIMRAGIYKNQNRIDAAVRDYMKSLELFRKLDKPGGMANCQINLSNMYSDMGEYEKALVHAKKSLAIYNSIDQLLGKAISTATVGNAYKILGNQDSASAYYNRALILAEETKNPTIIAGTLKNVGLIEADKGNTGAAREYYNRAMEIYQEVGFPRGQADVLLNLGHTYKADKDFHRALDYFDRALSLSKKVNVHRHLKIIYEAKYEINKKLGRHREALRNYEQYIIYRDSAESEKNQKEVIRQEYKYEYEKQAAADSVKAAEAAKLKDAKLEAERARTRQHRLEAKQQQQQKYVLFGGLAIALLFGGFIFNRFRITNKQKGIIEEQKEAVDEAYGQLEEKNQEILDSINYAKRIQSAILPHQKVVKSYLPQSFILYKPKDIVAGDFYWMEGSGEDTILFAAADCTGHGVPGAMVSVVCNNGLNRSVREHGLTDPGKILDKTREIVISEFEKSAEDVKDGMDISLVSLSPENKSGEQSGVESYDLKFAGANNPLWIIRKGGNEVEEIRGDKQPIGKFDHSKPFTTHTVNIHPGDSIYIFSDGFADQFGGEKGKKLKPANFKKLLISLQSESMNRQRELIDEAFEKWRGELEQLDDVCVIGVKV